MGKSDMSRLLAVIAAAVSATALLQGPAFAQNGPAPSPRTDYSRADSWLCRPDAATDACRVNIDTTVVAADGSTRIEPFKAATAPAFDCFYVYPTVSLDTSTYSDLTPGPEEFNVVRSQLARFGAECRLFAPMYRQFTLGALRARMSGGAPAAANGSPQDPNNDIDDAWRWYLENENKGRGVVLIGHSQGSGQLIRLIAAQIDGKPAQDKLISAMILGMSVQTPAGADTGGSFKSIPVCRSADQSGCVISYSTFRDTLPPSANASFGRGVNGMEAVCTNPAALDGSAATDPKAYFPTADKTWAKGVTIATPFVATPGLVETQCVRKGAHHYLEARFRGDPNDPRIDDPGTDVMAQGQADPAWGLHLIDANIGMGDLVSLASRQAAHWMRTKAR
jgi:hypothetical protein